MTEEEKVERIKKALDNFKQKVQKLREEHEVKIRKILAGIKEKEVKKIKTKLGME